MPKKRMCKGASSAIKRFLKPTINWAEMESLVNPEEKGKFMAFRGKSESYWRRVLSNPENPPPIDWDAYKKIVPDAGIVDKLKSAYEKYKVPMPTDTLTAEVTKQWEEMCPKIEEYNKNQQTVIDAAKKEVDRINALPNFDSITMEMFADMYPEEAIDPVKKPTFWPHTEDEQLGYVYPDQQHKH